MRHKPFRYDWALSVDLEASCFLNNQWPEGQKQDIIEVGITEIDLVKRELGRTASLVVKPLRSKISDYCTELTGWTQEAVDKGMTLLHASQILQEDFKSRERLFISQGDFDRTLFMENCTALGVPYPFQKRHLNIAAVYSIFTGLQRQAGMARELKELGLTLEGRHHNGGDDSRNIARIVLEMVKRCSIKVR